MSVAALILSPSAWLVVAEGVILGVAILAAFAVLRGKW